MSDEENAMNPKRPDSISENAWRVMQWLRNGDELYVSPDGEACVGLADVPVEAADELLSSGLLVKTDECPDGCHYRMTGEAWDIAAGDVRVK